MLTFWTHCMYTSPSVDAGQSPQTHIIKSDLDIPCVVSVSSKKTWWIGQHLHSWQCERTLTVAIFGGRPQIGSRPWHFLVAVYIFPAGKEDRNPCLFWGWPSSSSGIVQCHKVVHRQCTFKCTHVYLMYMYVCFVHSLCTVERPRVQALWTVYATGYERGREK